MSGWSQQLTFTRRYGRWLPAGLPAVSPDSSHYAYDELVAPDNHSRIHSVDVRWGVDRAVYDQGSYKVVDYESEGIYLAGVAGAGEGRIGLYLLDPASGALRQIASPQAAPFPFGIYLIGGGAGWFGDVAPGDQPPHFGPGAMDRLLRFDLHRKTITAWFRKPGMQVQAIGFDARGDPIVDAETMTQDTLQTTSQELWLVSGPSSARSIYTGPGATIADVVNFTSVLADDHGVWLGSKLGIFLYTSDGQFRRVSTTAADIAGRCS